MKQSESNPVGREGLPARHPTIGEAVAFVELCTDLPVLREAVRKGIPLQEVVRWLTEALGEGEAEDGPPDGPQLKARAQVRLPEFLRAYLAERLGLV
jgi:hypothetical protein